MPRKAKKTLKGLDLFSGAGGMSLGAINAGLDISLALDNDKDAASTFKRNHPETKFICEDIRNVDPQLLLNNDIDIIFGGPPCQGFSSSNTKTRNLNNEKNFLFREFVKFVRIIKPRWFVFENVEGLVTFNKGETVREIEAIFQNLGYKTSSTVLCASDYGVPQQRNRFFMVGNNIGVDFDFPHPSNQIVTVNDAISDLPILNNGDNFDELPYSRNNNLSKYAKLMRGKSKKSTQNHVSRNKEYVIERYRHIKQGENWSAIPQHLMTNYTNTHNCHSGIYKRLNSTKPSVVISNYRKNMLIHPFADRGLSVREAARLQSFPDDFIFEGLITYTQQQIGNAVPPMLAEVIFKQIVKY